MARITLMIATALWLAAAGTSHATVVLRINATEDGYITFSSPTSFMSHGPNFNGLDGDACWVPGDCGLWGLQAFSVTSLPASTGLFWESGAGLGDMSGTIEWNAANYSELLGTFTVDSVNGASYFSPINDSADIVVGSTGVVDFGLGSELGYCQSRQPPLPDGPSTCLAILPGSTISITPTVPEPTSMSILGMALGLLLIRGYGLAGSGASRGVTLPPECPHS